MKFFFCFMSMTIHFRIPILICKSLYLFKDGQKVFDVSFKRIKHGNFNKSFLF